MRIISMLFLAFSLLLPVCAFAQVNPVTTERDCGISSLSGSSQTIAVANPNRKYLGLFNSGNASVYVNAAGGTAASTGIASIPVTSGGSLLFKLPEGIPRNAITIIGTSGQPVACFEGN
jgi:hypothetical protein